MTWKYSKNKSSPSATSATAKEKREILGETYENEGSQQLPFGPLTLEAAMEAAVN